MFYSYEVNSVVVYNTKIKKKKQVPLVGSV